MSNDDILDAGKDLERELSLTLRTVELRSKNSRHSRASQDVESKPDLVKRSSGTGNLAIRPALRGQRSQPNLLAVKESNDEVNGGSSEGFAEFMKSGSNNFPGHRPNGRRTLTDGENMAAGKVGDTVGEG